VSSLDDDTESERRVNLMTGQDIRRAREAGKVSQGELVEHCGFMSRGTVRDIESGRVEVTSAWALQVIAVVHGIAASKGIDIAQQSAA
jgi:DNA-binding transcriptional regulator YiaG